MYYRAGLSGLAFESTPDGTRPIERAEVLSATDMLVIDDYWKAKTAADGHYEFPDVWGNVVFVLARKEGYDQSAQVTLVIGRNQAVTHNIELKRR